jgi:hypothetical protein
MKINRELMNYSLQTRLCLQIVHESVISFKTKTAEDPAILYNIKAIIVPR